MKKKIRNIILVIIGLFVLSQVTAVLAYHTLSPVDQCFVKTQLERGNRPMGEQYKKDTWLVQTMCEVLNEPIKPHKGWHQ